MKPTNREWGPSRFIFRISTIAFSLLSSSESAASESVFCCSLHHELNHLLPLLLLLEWMFLPFFRVCIQSSEWVHKGTRMEGVGGGDWLKGQQNVIEDHAIELICLCENIYSLQTRGQVPCPMLLSMLHSFHAVIFSTCVKCLCISIYMVQEVRGMGEEGWLNGDRTGYDLQHGEKL
jgi:hypothetical protein